MFNIIKKQIPRLISSLRAEFKSWRQKENSFAASVTACKSHIAAFWHEVTKPPATEERKRAIQYLHVGINLYNKKRFLDAVHAFRRSLDADPKYSRAHLYYGNAQYKLHNTDEAIASWEFAVRVDPDSEAGLKARKN